MNYTKFTDEASKTFVLDVQDEIAEREILTDPDLLSEAIGEHLDGDLFQMLVDALVQTDDEEIKNILRCMAIGYAQVMGKS